MGVNPILLNGLAGQAPAQPVVQLASPLNDTQLVALVACQSPHRDADDAVEWALDVVAGAFAKVGSGELSRRMLAAKKAAEQDT